MLHMDKARTVGVGKNIVSRIQETGVQFRLNR